MTYNYLTMERVRIVRLTQDYVFKSFDCGDEDLNDFLLKDSKAYLQNRLSVTYIMETSDRTIGYFSVLNDKLALYESDKATWRKVKHLFKHAKHRSDYPAVKIGRLAIDKKYQNHHIGTDMLNFIKFLFSERNQSGCAFITVDALKSATPFYLKNRFKHLRKDELQHDCDTCQLYFELGRLDK